MGIKLGLDVGTEFITASLLNGDQRRNAFSRQVGDKIPAIIVAYRDNDQWKFKYGQEAVDAMESDQRPRGGGERRHFATTKPLKFYLRTGEKNLLINTSIHGEEVGTVESIVKPFFETIFKEIKNGLIDRDLNEEIEVIAVGYPNDRTADSANYYTALINYIKQAYECVFAGTEPPTVLVRAEAYYAAELLRRINILSEGEIALVVDIGAGTTDFAFVRIGDNFNIEGSCDFGGYNVDTILYEKFGVRREISPEMKINYKNWFLNGGRGNKVIPNVNKTQIKDVYSAEIENENSAYRRKLNRLAQKIKNKADQARDRMDDLKNDFKIILTGGSCSLPFVEDAIKEQFQGYSPTFIIMDRYRKDGEQETEAERRCIDNETFMSYAAALVAESYVNRRYPTTGTARGRVDMINVGGFGIIAISAIDDDNNTWFYKLIEAEPDNESITVLVEGQFYTLNEHRKRADVFKGIWEDIYFLHENGRCENESKGSDRWGTELKVRNTQCQVESGIIYETTYISESRYKGLKRYIEMAFTPKCNGGKALVLDNEGREITSQPDNKTHNYNVEVTYNYGAFVSNDERIQVKYIQVP